MNTDKLLDTLKQAEGCRLTPYPDSNGNLTVGYGHRLLVDDMRPITQEEADGLLLQDTRHAMSQASVLSYWPMVEQDDVRSRVIVEMVFNLGFMGVKQFRKMAAAISRNDWAKAAAEILDSEAARQLPERYLRLSTMMLGDIDL